MNDRPWQPSRPVAALIGLLSLWPIIYFVLFLFFIGYTFMKVNAPGQNGAVPAAFKYILVAHLLTMLLMFMLMATYIIHAFKTDRIPSDKKVLWVVVILFGSIIACPIYWYLYMWRSARPSSFSATNPSVAAG